MAGAGRRRRGLSRQQRQRRRAQPADRAARGFRRRRFRRRGERGAGRAIAAVPGHRLVRAGDGQRQGQYSRLARPDGRPPRRRGFGRDRRLLSRQRAGAVARHPSAHRPGAGDDPLADRPFAARCGGHQDGRSGCARSGTGKLGRAGIRRFPQGARLGRIQTAWLVSGGLSRRLSPRIRARGPPPARCARPALVSVQPARRPVSHRGRQTLRRDPRRAALVRRGRVLRGQLGRGCAGLPSARGALPAAAAEPEGHRRRQISRHGTLLRRIQFRRRRPARVRPRRRRRAGAFRPVRRFMRHPLGLARGLYWRSLPALSPARFRWRALRRDGLAGCRRRIGPLLFCGAQRKIGRA